MEVNVNMLKRQLNIELDYLDDDILLQHMLNTAEAAVSTYLGTNALTGYTGNTMPDEVIHAVILLAANFYLNRNIVSFAQGYEIPYSFKFLLGPYKDYVIC